MGSAQEAQGLLRTRADGWEPESASGNERNIEERRGRGCKRVVTNHPDRPHDPLQNALKLVDRSVRAGTRATGPLGRLRTCPSHICSEFITARAPWHALRSICYVLTEDWTDNECHPRVRCARPAAAAGLSSRGSHARHTSSYSREPRRGQGPGASLAINYSHQAVLISGWQSLNF
jgi:hypothetical protein